MRQFQQMPLIYLSNCVYWYVTTDSFHLALKLSFNKFKKTCFQTKTLSIVSFFLRCIVIVSVHRTHHQHAESLPHYQLPFAHCRGESPSIARDSHKKLLVFLHLHILKWTSL